MAKKSRSQGRAEYMALVRRKEQEKRKVPTEEDFARAHAAMAAELRILATVRDCVMRSFLFHLPLHDILLFPSRKTNYQAYVFYESNADVESCRVSGADEELKYAIAQAFASTSDTGTAPTVAVEFDSYENVKKKCNGDYRKYLG